ncbi:GLIPR1-like protein 1 [Mytilus trossulus]|uniref:GLIPR1-like protein 1 n=1 Tax=Mytilus trossulus TaxID=6551 RepID=UPI003007919F
MKFYASAVIFSMCLMLAFGVSDNLFVRKLENLISRLEKDTDKPTTNGDIFKNGEGIKHTGPAVNAPRSLKMHRRSTGSDLSVAESDHILNLHIVARQQVQPPASNMANMHWDNELAATAQEYANKCIWGHNSARSNPPTSFSYVGENIYVQTNTMNTDVLENGFTAWDDEKNGFHYDTNTCSNAPCGHYTQIIWAESTALGCGVSHCPSMANLPDYSFIDYWEFLVCNYGPGGNVNGRLPYVESSSGSSDGAGGESAISNGCRK